MAGAEKQGSGTEDLGLNLGEIQQENGECLAETLKISAKCTEGTLQRGIPRIEVFLIGSRFLAHPHRMRSE